MNLAQNSRIFQLRVGKCSDIFFIRKALIKHSQGPRMEYLAFAVTRSKDDFIALSAGSNSRKRTIILPNESWRTPYQGQKAVYYFWDRNCSCQQAWVTNWQINKDHVNLGQQLTILRAIICLEQMCSSWTKCSFACVVCKYWRILHFKKRMEAWGGRT